MARFCNTFTSGFTFGFTLTTALCRSDEVHQATERSFASFRIEILDNPQAARFQSHPTVFLQDGSDLSLVPILGARKGVSSHSIICCIYLSSSGLYP